MRGLKLIAFIALLSAIEGLHLKKRTESPRVVQFLVEKRRLTSDLVSKDRLRRRVVEQNLDNKDTLYFINATLGTPAQKIRLHLDTGSSDLWVNTPVSALCSSFSRPCVNAGAYRANTSSSYSYVASNFNISYVDGSGAQGDYVTDTLTIGGKKIKKFQFGVGYNSSSSQGILGIGYAVNEVQVGRAGKKPYANLPMRMVKDGLINSNAYSLWLNDLDASTGNILFGGIDTAQFVGPLQTLPIQKGGSSFSEFFVTLTGLSLGNTTIAKDIAQGVLLDSGSSLTYLPDSLTESIYNLLGAKYNPTEGAAYVPCSLARSSFTLDFTFSQPVIKVDMSELVIPDSGNNGRTIAFADGTPACLFGIAPAGEGTSVMGDTFIRSAYLVYDLDNNQISIAQTNFNATDHKILEIGKGRDAVPNALVVQTPITATSGIYGGSSAGSSQPESAAHSPVISLLIPATVALVCSIISANV